MENLQGTVWGRALRLVQEGNVKLHNPSDTHTIFKVIGESDSYTVGVDMDSREISGCMCGDKTYNGVENCYHEVAVHIALAVLDESTDKDVKDAILEKPELHVRTERQF